MDNTDTARILSDLRQIRMSVWLLIAITVAVIATQIFVLLRLPILQMQGTEPPIRVRGGSLHFELLAGGAAWTSPTNSTEDTDWGIDPDYRFTDDIHMQIKASHYTEDCPVLATVKKVTFTYRSDDGKVTNDVTVQATGNKTKVTAKSKMKKDSSSSVVYDLENHGYISAIKGTGNGQPVSCTFGPGDLSDVILSQW